MYGSIYLTRNTEEVGNDSPGHWNHAAIVYKDMVIEAQSIPGCVIQVHEDSFRQRYPEFILLDPVNEIDGELASVEALKMIGMPYRAYASQFFRRKRGHNCVSVCREAYMLSLGYDPGWVIPDHIICFLFKEVEHKLDNEWKPIIDDWFPGRIR